MKIYRSEKGQTIVMIVIALVAILAFAGLAVDGGRVFSEQRRAQNAADAAAFAAGLAAVEGDDPYLAALEQAALNDFSDTDENINTGQQVDVIVNNPPTEGQYVGDPDYYEVIVRTILTGTFSRVIMIDELPVQAYAVVHARGLEASAGDNAVHGLDEDGIAVEFQGDAILKVKHGNIMSNGAIDKDGSAGQIHLDDGGIYYVDGDADSWKGDIVPLPEHVNHPDLVDSVPEPDCGTVYQTGPQLIDGEKVYRPGIYEDQIRINAHDHVVFKPGLYCLWEGIKDNGNSITEGTGVTFVLLGGDLLFNGNSEIYLTRPNDLLDNAGNQWGGMLIYVSPENVGAEVEITGNTGTVYAGTIYSPTGLCKVSGEAEMMGLKSNIVCHHVLFHGNPNVYIDYNPVQNWRPPASLDLAE